MKYSKEVWNQLKNITADKFIKTLQNDHFKPDITQGYSSGARIVFLHPDGRRIAIDYHSGKTYGPKLLKHLLADTGWSVERMQQLKLIK